MNFLLYTQKHPKFLSGVIAKVRGGKKENTPSEDGVPDKHHKATKQCDATTES